VSTSSARDVPRNLVCSVVRNINAKQLGASLMHMRVAWMATSYIAATGGHINPMLPPSLTYSPDMFNQHSKSMILLQWYFYQPSQDLLEWPFNAPHSKHRGLVLAIPQ
jgi:hypothetical protein